MMTWLHRADLFVVELVLRFVFDLERVHFVGAERVYCASTPLTNKRFLRSSTMSPGSPITRLTYSVSSRGDGNVTTSPRCGSAHRAIRVSVNGMRRS